MATQRFFVANLTKKTKESDLTNIFQDYGEVIRVELKTKAGLSEEDEKFIGFVTLKISAEDAEYCAKEVNWKKIHGAQIKVSIAKESFLDRLKREREEAAAAQSGNVQQTKESTSTLLQQQNFENKRKTFDENEEIDDDDIPAELMIAKKRAARSLQNGKIIIENYDATPIHVIEKPSKKAKTSNDTKISKAEQKRQESMNKMKGDYEKRKNAVQQALSGMDTSSSKKIKFTDAEEDNDANEVETIPKLNAKLFDSDDEEADDADANLNLKSKHFGKKGEKLAELKSQQNLDPRFKMDEKFIEGNDGDADDDDETEQNDADGVENERDWQMNLLEQVIGHKLDTETSAQKAAKSKKMLRFDPSKSEDKKYLRNNEKNTKKSKNSLTDNTEDMNEEYQTDDVPEVSKEAFYMVSDTLAQSLKTRGGGFSLLNMFGNSANALENEREDQLRNVANEKILVNSKIEKSALNPFTYDSSSSDEEGDIDNVRKQHKKVKNNAQRGNDGTAKNVTILMEPFFITKNDARLVEGANFFKFEKSTTGNDEDYEAVRNRLKLLIKTKINKSKKNQFGKKPIIAGRIQKHRVKGKTNKKVF